MLCCGEPCRLLRRKIFLVRADSGGGGSDNRNYDEEKKKNKVDQPVK